ncbi:MAG: bifunctional diguanylate cyclase/phosphodiesterase, partial [Proteobacteria bacterium]|nr:bifunctional diguanylate cyclase/phosphodiesterase [Pseudomonadota bacterium]
IEERLHVESQRSKRQSTSMVALLVDLDDFKKLNDNFGYSGGDAVLVEVARRIRALLREVDHVSRIGGDEFLVLLPDTRRSEGVLMAERLRTTISIRRFMLPKRTDVIVTASIGALHLTEAQADLDAILRFIHPAIALSKASGKNRIVVAGERLDSAPLPVQFNDPSLSSENLWAVAHPIMRLLDGDALGHELLIRGSLGPFQLPPDLYKLALEHRILSMIDLRCLQACSRAAVTRELKVCHLNLFPTTIKNTKVKQILAILEQADSAATWCIEISENLLVGDPSVLQHHVQKLQEAGVLVAIDHVGRGRSSLEALIMLKPDIIKIDGRYVTGAHGDIIKETSLRRLVPVAKALGARLIAEGIETEEDFEFVKSVGITEGQGYFWGQPA